MSILLLPNKKGKSKTKKGVIKMGYGNNFGAFGNALLDIFTFGGFSRERERQEQEKLNKLQIEREDTAYQRTVKDMNKAGLNPLTMSGTDGAQPLTNPIKSENNTFDKAMQLGTTIASVSSGLAQAKNLNAGTAGMVIQNAMAQMDLDNLKKLGLSPTEYTHKNQKEIGELSKGFWGRVGNDIYDKLDGKIERLIDKGTEIVNKGIKSLEKGEFKDAVKEKVDTVMDKGADKLVEKTGKVGKVVKDYGEIKKKIYSSAYYERMQYAQKEIDYWSKVPNAENLKKVNEFRKMYKDAEENLKKTYGAHWRDYL